jgi:tRNA1Val (adenine37-N6)-methyltransferase
MFHFKKFSLEDNMSSMKVGTDSLLLGISAETNGISRILDIGTGCGIIALMLAQKSCARIDAVEIDHQSCIQATENFKLSPWSNRLTVIEADLKDYTENCRLTFGLIVSNPPFFSSGLRKHNPSKGRARHTDALSFYELCLCTTKLLDKKGVFSTILPANRFSEFIEVAKKCNLHLKKNLLVHSYTDANPVRYISAFVFECPDKIDIDRIVLRNRSGNYTTQFKRLADEFLLDRGQET